MSTSERRAVHGRREGGGQAPRRREPERVRQVAVPDRVRALSTLGHVDYADAFRVRVGPVTAHTATGWARLVLEEAPLAVRGGLQSGWSALGLRLEGGSSAEHVLGWRVARATPGAVLLTAGSRVGMPGELLFRRERGQLLFATFVRLGNPAARTAWRGVEPVHVVAVRRLLERVSRSAAP